MWSLTDVERVVFRRFPGFYEAPWWSETLTFICLQGLPMQETVQLPHDNLEIRLERKVSVQGL